jgi:hypothetical protein
VPCQRTGKAENPDGAGPIKAAKLEQKLESVARRREQNGRPCPVTKSRTTPAPLAAGPPHWLLARAHDARVRHSVPRALRRAMR